MSSKTLGRLIKISVIILAVFGAFLCLFAVPSFGESIISDNPELASWFWPWQIFVWVLALPCYAILVFVWKFGGAVSKESVFTDKTAGWVKSAALLLLLDGALLFIGCIVLMLLNMCHPGILLLCIAADIVIVIAFLFVSLLSRYITKAAALQEESEGTL